MSRQRKVDPQGHHLYCTADPDRPEAICDRNGEVVLACCVICGRGEVQLEEPCIDPKWLRALANGQAVPVTRTAFQKMRDDLGLMGEAFDAVLTTVKIKEDGS